MARRITTTSGKAAPRGPFIYIGPSLPGLACSRIYSSMPEKLPCEDGCPFVRTLLIPIAEYMEARRLMGERGTTYNVAARRVSEYARGGSV